MKKTEARKMFEARKGSYGGGISGTLDETDLLLLSQDAEERAETVRAKARRLARDRSYRKEPS